MRWTLPVAAILTAFAWCGTIQAHGLNHLHRHTGFGWGDGYHSRTDCPPRKSLSGLPCPTCAPASAGWSPDRAAYRAPGSGSAAPLLPHWDKMPSRRQ